MPIVDENGDLFGTVNAVDAAAVVLVALVAVGGVALFAGSGGGAEEGVLTQTVTLRTTADASPGIASLEPGPVGNGAVVSITDIERAGDGSGGSRSAEVWTLDARLAIDTEDGLATFDGERLYVGRNLTLRAGGVTVSGVVTGAFEPVRVQSVPTPTPERTATPEGTATDTPAATATPTPAGETRLVTVEATVDPGVAETVDAGPASATDVVAIREVTRRSAGDSVTLSLRLEVAVREVDGTTYFRGVALDPGTRLLLELDGEPVAATVTGA
jgi:hypothetical protein